VSDRRACEALGSPGQRAGASAEAFSSRFGQECLEEHWLLSVGDAQERVGEWRRHYGERPNGSLGDLTPEVFGGPAKEPWGPLPGLEVEPSLAWNPALQVDQTRGQLQAGLAEIPSGPVSGGKVTYGTPRRSV